MEAKKQIYLSLLSIKYNIIREIVDSKAFILSIFLSILNNAVFIVQWIILFNLRNEMGGYKFNGIFGQWHVPQVEWLLFFLMALEDCRN